MASAFRDGLAARTLEGDALGRALVDAHERTWAILAGLAPEQWAVPYHPGINPPQWEYGHVAWFTELWVLREAQWNARDELVMHRPSLLSGADRWFDSGRVPHTDRWALDLPPLDALRDYAGAVLDTVLAKLGAANGEGTYPFQLALFHADMHGEALTYMRQILDYSTPYPLAIPPRDAPAGDAVIDAGAFVQGSVDGAGFVFDNEKWAHEVTLDRTKIARRCVTNAEYLRFVEAGGYRERSLWSDAGWSWCADAGITQPQRWRKCGDGGWEQRWFGAWLPLAGDRPVCHVNAHEAEAFCRWAGRRLPGEAEWERAAVLGAIDWGRSVWEWTSDAFAPYPGFSADRYRDYSAPWFATHRSVRGGSFATVPRMHHPRYRNFYLPERNDIFVGFRTCAPRNAAGGT
ncbi:MAG: selenoneine synthase SenA [Casimicrobiaceae bacterium]